MSLGWETGGPLAIFFGGNLPDADVVRKDSDDVSLEWCASGRSIMRLEASFMYDVRCRAIELQPIRFSKLLLLCFKQPINHLLVGIYRRGMIETRTGEDRITRIEPFILQLTAAELFAQQVPGKFK
jgi:hypothetical protein